MMTIEYVAGFFDGEGSVSISVRGRNRQTYLKLIFSNTDEVVLKEIQKLVGGKISCRNRNSSKWAPAFVLTVIGTEAHKALIDMLPFLWTKKRRAELALEFWGFREANKSPRRKNSPLATIGLEYKERMHELNRKGPINGEIAHSTPKYLSCM